jgi:excisionase family DNA binding protein
MVEKQVYSLKEVQSLLGFGRSAVYAAIHSGEIPSVKIGRRIVVRKTVIDDLLAGVVPKRTERRRRATQGA